MKQLPKSYKDLSWQKYVAIINKIPSERPAQLDAVEWSRLVHMTTLSILMDTTEGEIEQLRASEVMQLIQDISFMDVAFKAEKTAFKVKDIDELTYDEFVTYQKLRVDQWNNLGDILLLVLKDHTAEQVEALSIYDVMQVFFCLKTSIDKSLKRLKYLTLRKAIVQTIKALLRRLKRQPRTSLKVVGGGLT